MNTAQLHAAVYAQALGYPEAYVEEPWGHPAVKVRKKAFLFCSSLGAAEPSLGVKLPLSAAEALLLPSVKPMGYGLGRHGWCAVDVSPEVPLERMLDWVDESYRAVAPKRLVAQLGADRPASAVLEAGGREEAQVERLPRVLLVGAGPQRLQRAIDALGEVGVPATAVSLEDALDVAGNLQPEAVVADVGRRASAVRPLLADLAVVCPDASLWIVGATAKGAPDEVGSVAASYREPPGDPVVVAALRAALAD